MNNDLIPLTNDEYDAMELPGLVTDEELDGYEWYQLVLIDGRKQWVRMSAEMRERLRMDESIAVFVSQPLLAFYRHADGEWANRMATPEEYRLVEEHGRQPGLWRVAYLDSWIQGLVHGYQINPESF